MDLVPGASGAKPGRPFKPPTACPACMGLLVRRDGSGGHALVCTNPGCGGQAERALLHWVER
jgi:NAD-dependent DNA ligase